MPRLRMDYTGEPYSAAFQWCRSRLVQRAGARPTIASAADAGSVREGAVPSQPGFLSSSRRARPSAWKAFPRTATPCSCARPVTWSPTSSPAFCRRLRPPALSVYRAFGSGQPSLRSDAWHGLREEVADAPSWSTALRRTGLFIGKAPDWTRLGPAPDEVAGPKPERIAPRPVGPDAGSRVWPRRPQARAVAVWAARRQCWRSPERWRAVARLWACLLGRRTRTVFSRSVPRAASPRVRRLVRPGGD